MVGVAALAVSLAFEVRFVQAPGLSHRLLVTLAVWAAAAGVGMVAVLRSSRRAGAALLVAGTLALHAVPLTAIPRTSDDLYRYAWDGTVQAAGIDPYRYAPVDPALDRFHDPWLWPDPAGCAAIHKPPGCTRINRPTVHTIYPPVAELWFLALHPVRRALQLGGPPERGLQVPDALLSLVLTAVLAAGLRALRRNPLWAVVYAWSPVAAIETASAAHVDVLGGLLAVGGVWALARGRRVLGGALVGAATVVKLLPALLAPVVVRRRPWRGAVALVGVVALSYLPHVAAVGAKVIGFLPGYLSEENYNDGGRFLLLRLVGLGGTAAQAVAALILLAVVVWVLRADAPPQVAAVRMLGAFWLVATPVTPWYALLLLPVAVLAQRWEWLVVALAGYPLYFEGIIGTHPAGYGEVSYGVAAVVVAAAGGWRRRGHRASA